MKCCELVIEFYDHSDFELIRDESVIGHYCNHTTSDDGCRDYWKARRESLKIKISRGLWKKNCHFNL